MEKRTSKPEYGPYIVDAMRILGPVDRDMLLAEVKRLMDDVLHNADMVVLPNGEPRWRNQAQHMLDGLVDNGVIIEKKGLLSLAES